ncbi:MAG TPA: hypothetical protein VFT87_05380 [Candidatus Saccharimonadales bacterium]|nr:hypothetical protein [Candidatus Saccharimonadales bacterium]
MEQLVHQFIDKLEACWLEVLFDYSSKFAKELKYLFHMSATATPTTSRIAMTVVIEVHLSAGARRG